MGAKASIEKKQQLVCYYYLQIEKDRREVQDLPVSVERRTLLKGRIDRYTEELADLEEELNKYL